MNLEDVDDDGSAHASILFNQLDIAVKNDKHIRAFDKANIALTVLKDFNLFPEKHMASLTKENILRDTCLNVLIDFLTLEE
jgi:hypothetical protein